MRIAESELILNPDGSIYHLNLSPGEIGNTVITVGDPSRVEMVSDFFEKIELKKSHREFITHTGTFNGKRISVISTGIGTDNIDIVLNELDALVNIDFHSRTIKEELTSLDIVRIGTSGTIRPEIQVDDHLTTEYAIGFDNFLHFYKDDSFMEKDFVKSFKEHTNWSDRKSEPYLVAADAELLELSASLGFAQGITVTNVGFYGPQSRVIRLQLQDDTLNKKLTSFRYKNIKITNHEMESAGIYGLSKLLGHRPISFNTILANRATREFSERPLLAVKDLIEKVLNTICP